MRILFASTLLLGAILLSSTDARSDQAEAQTNFGWGNWCNLTVCCGPNCRSYEGTGCNGFLGDVCICYAWCTGYQVSGFCYCIPGPFGPMIDAEMGGFTTFRAPDDPVWFKITTGSKGAPLSVVAGKLNELTGWAISIKGVGDRLIPSKEWTATSIEDLVKDLSESAKSSYVIDNVERRITFENSK